MQLELILLKIALQAGLITPTLFTIMVIMAIVTTLMAAPGFNLARRWRTGLSALLGSRGVRGPILEQRCDGAGNKLSQLMIESAPVRFLYRFPDGTKPLVIAETN